MDFAITLRTMFYYCDTPTPVENRTLVVIYGLLSILILNVTAIVMII